MRKGRLFVTCGLVFSLLLGLAPLHSVANEEVTPETETILQEEETVSLESTEEIVSETSEPKPLLKVSTSPVSVKNTRYFEFDYYSSTVECYSEDESIAQVSVSLEGYDPEMECNVAGIMVYGIRSGTTTIVISAVGSDEEVRKEVIVEKPETITGKQKLINHMLEYGQTNELQDKELMRELPESGAKAYVEYATMDDVINFRYVESGEEKIEWNLIPTPTDNTEYYITMHMGDDFVTATIDLVSYAGENLIFDEGWFKIPVEDKMQEKANLISGHAFEAIKNLMYEETGMMPGDIFQVYELDAPIPEMG